MAALAWGHSFTVSQHRMGLLTISKTGPQFPAPAREEIHHEWGED